MRSIPYKKPQTNKCQFFWYSHISISIIHNLQAKPQTHFMFIEMNNKKRQYLSNKFLTKKLNK